MAYDLFLEKKIAICMNQWPINFIRKKKYRTFVNIKFREFRRITTELVGAGDNIIPRIPSDSDGIGRSG